MGAFVEATHTIYRPLAEKVFLFIYGATNLFFDSSQMSSNQKIKVLG